MMTGMGANIHLHLKQQKRKETIPSIHARKTPKKNQFFVFWKPPKYDSTGVSLQAHNVQEAIPGIRCAKVSSTEWRISSTVKNLQPGMYPVDTHMWLAEAKTFCFYGKNSLALKQMELDLQRQNLNAKTKGVRITCVQQHPRSDH